VEVSLAVIVLTTSAMLIQSYIQFDATDPGMNPEGVLTARVALPVSSYESEEQRAQFYQALHERLQTVPAITHAAMVQAMPLGSLRWGRGYTVEGEEVTPEQQPTITYYWVIQGDYLGALGIPLLRGRDFEHLEPSEDPASFLIVTETFASNHWPGENPIGKRIKWGRADSERPWIEVIGLAADLDERAPGTTPDPACYLALGEQQPEAMYLVLRTDGEPMDLVQSVKSAVWSLDRELPVVAIQTMEDFVWDLYWPAAMAAWLITVFSAIALILAGVGIYGVVAYSVSRRTREMGIRIALGARRDHVVSLIARQVTGMTALGIVIGVGIAFPLTRLASTGMFGVTPPGVLLQALVAVVMAVIALAACYLPARRAARIDPIEAVNYE
jgi:putative ABC transport system permease protein